MEVAREARRRPNDDLPDPVPVGRIDPDLHPGEWPAGTARMAGRLARGQRGDRRGGLGQAVGRHDRPAAGERALHQGNGDRATTEEDGAERRRGCRSLGVGVVGGGGGGVGRLEQAQQLGRDERHVAGPEVTGQGGEDRPAVRRSHDDEGHAVKRRTPHDTESGHMPEPDGEDPAGRRREDGQPGLGADP